jgi:hypothetical protein
LMGKNWGSKISCNCPFKNLFLKRDHLYQCLGSLRSRSAWQPPCGMFMMFNVLVISSPRSRNWSRECTAQWRVPVPTMQDKHVAIPYNDGLFIIFFYIESGYGYRCALNSPPQYMIPDSAVPVLHLLDG